MHSWPKQPIQHHTCAKEERTMMNPMQPSEFFSRMTSNAVEAFSLCAEANQKILRELVDLSASAAKEGVRLYAELQSSAVATVKDGQSLFLRRQAEMQEAPKDPLGFYQQSVLESVEGAQKAFNLLEGNAQAITRSARRDAGRGPRGGGGKRKPGPPSPSWRAR